MIIIRVIILFLLLVLSYACSQNKADKAERITHEIISALFLEIVDTTYYYYFDPPSSFNYSLPIEKYYELYTFRDKHKLAIFIDTMNSSRKDLDAMLSSAHSSISKELDPIEIALFEKNTHNKMRLNNLHGIINTGRYELFYKNNQLVLDRNYTTIGEIHFTNIAFDEGMNIGGFTYTIYRGPRNAKSEFIIVNKVNNKWVLKKKILLWIS
ncbi:MAG: hypothetical protein NTX65_02195 [Ignavibacteriales bacterium]|nr:hypothetical protein [Ignavibacteriales bacterium]